jgi:3-oxoacyl-[acyl-carrier-protein] synthase II
MVPFVCCGGIITVAIRLNIFIQGLTCEFFVQRIAGEIKSFSTEGWVVPKLSKRMDKFMLYLITAGKKALENGGLTEEVRNELDKTRCGVLIGSAMGGMKVGSPKLY